MLTCLRDLRKRKGYTSLCHILQVINWPGKLFNTNNCLIVGEVERHYEQSKVSMSGVYTFMLDNNAVHRQDFAQVKIGCLTKINYY